MGASALKLTPPAPKSRRGKAPKSRAEKIASFSIPEALARADAIFEGPCQGHIPRVAGKGELVQRFVLPLELLQRQNATRRPQPGLLARTKEQVFRMMFVQCGGVQAHPLPGRPLVLCARFSSAEPDAFADSFKMAVDCLCVPRQPKKPGGRKKLGLGFLVDDAPKFAEVHQWWERARVREGFGMISIWTGQP